MKLTKTSGDTYSQLGFMPLYHGYESTITHFAAQWSPTYFTSDGKSNVANDPPLAATYQWQKALVGKLGGVRPARQATARRSVTSSATTTRS